MNEKVEKPIMDGIAADARHGIGANPMTSVSSNTIHDRLFHFFIHSPPLLDGQITILSYHEKCISCQYIVLFSWDWQRAEAAMHQEIRTADLRQKDQKATVC